MVFHIGALPLNSQRWGGRLWAGLAPQTRLLVVLCLVVAISLTPNGRWWTWAVYGCTALGLIGLAQVNWWTLCQRLAVESAFISVVLVGTLFHTGGDVLWQWGGLQITTIGLTILGSVSLKAILCLLLFNLLTLTTSVPDLLHGLATLKTPPLLLAIVSAMARYVDVLQAEVHGLQRAAISRNLTRNPSWRRQVLGNMIGMLFLRTYDRGDRIHRAMIARGYTGLPPQLRTLTPGWRDRLVLGVIMLIGLLGQLV